MAEERKEVPIYSHYPHCTIYRIWNKRRACWVFPKIASIRAADAVHQLQKAIGRKNYRKLYHASPYLNFKPFPWKWKFRKDMLAQIDAEKLSADEQKHLAKIMAEVENLYRNKEGIPITGKALASNQQMARAHKLAKQLKLKRGWSRNLPYSCEAYRRFIVGLEAIIRHQKEEKKVGV